MSVISDRIYAARNALLGSLKFQRIASSVPVVRGIARRRAQAVFDLCAGFVYSQTLYAAIELDLFEKLSRGPKALDELATALGLRREAARTLLDAAAALHLVDRLADGRYRMGAHGAVISANPGIVKMVKHHAMLYADLADPVALLRGERGETELSRYWAYAKARAPSDVSDRATADYTELMSASQTLIAEEVLATYPLRAHRRLLDIGGGDGTFLRAVAKAAPNLHLTLFDLPAVADRARTMFESAGLSGRATAFGGDFFKDALPSGCDLVTLVRIIHDHDDDPVQNLFANVRRALLPGGRILIAEPMSGSGRAETFADAYFGFYLTAMGSGRPRSAPEIIAMLQREGFTNARAIKTRMPLQTSVIVADAPKTYVNAT